MDPIQKQIEEEQKKLIVKSFCEKPEIQARLMEWQKQHPHHRPPIYYDEKTRTCYWMTRAQRRRLQKGNK